MLEQHAGLVAGNLFLATNKSYQPSTEQYYRRGFCRHRFSYAAHTHGGRVQPQVNGQMCAGFFNHQTPLKKILLHVGVFFFPQYLGSSRKRSNLPPWGFPSLHTLSWSQRRSRRPVAGRDVAPGLDSTTQVNSDSEGTGQVSGELLDALERDLNVVVAPKRRVRRVFNDDDEFVVPLSRCRFQALSSDEPARGELPTQVDRKSSVFDITVADSPDEDEDRVVPLGCAKMKTCGVDSPVGHSTVSAQHVWWRKYQWS